MATKTVTFTHTVNGSLADATDVRLSDPTATFGIKRNDTDEVLVADNTAMDHPSTGVYTYEFTEPDGATSYTAYIEWVYGGETFRAERLLSSTSASQYLTTLVKVKLYLNESGTSNDTYLTNLLGAASRFIEKYLNTFVLTDSYTDYVSGTGTCLLVTPNRWITSVSRVATTPEAALEITNTSTSVQRAYVKLEDGTLSLVRTVSGTTTTNTITVSSYATLSLLEAAIEAVGNGWSASVLAGMGSFPSSDIRSNFYGSAANGDVAILEAFTDELEWQRRDDEWGVIYSRRFPCGFKNIEVRYEAGFDADDIPDDIQAACAALTAGLYRASRQGGGGLKSETIGDYKYENFDISKMDGFLKGVALDAWLLLQGHRRYL